MIFYYHKTRFTLGETEGLTLIEVLIAVALIVILISIGVPTFNAFQPTVQLSGVARNLIADLHYAQQLAVTEQIDYGIYFFVADNKYQVVRHNDTATTSVKEVVLPNEVAFQVVTSNEIRFNAYGAANEATTTLINSKGEIKTIKVSPAGFAKMLD